MSKLARAGRSSGMSASSRSKSRLHGARQYADRTQAHAGLRRHSCGFRRGRRRDLRFGGAGRRRSRRQHRRAGVAGRPRAARRGALRSGADGARLHHHSHRAPLQTLWRGDQVVRRDARQDATGRARLARPRRRLRRSGETRRRRRRLAARNRRPGSRPDARPGDGGQGDRSRQIGAQQRADAEFPRRAAKRAQRRRRLAGGEPGGGRKRARLHALCADHRLDPGARRRGGGRLGAPSGDRQADLRHDRGDAPAGGRRDRARRARPRPRRRGGIDGGGGRSLPRRGDRQAASSTPKPRRRAARSTPNAPPAKRATPTSAGNCSRRSPRSAPACRGWRPRI